MALRQGFRVAAQQLARAAAASSAPTSFAAGARAFASGAEKSGSSVSSRVCGVCVFPASAARRSLASGRALACDWQLASIRSGASLS